MKVQQEILAIFGIDVELAIHRFLLLLQIVSISLRSLLEALSHFHTHPVKARTLG